MNPTSRRESQLRDAAAAAGARACARCTRLFPPALAQDCELDDCPRTLVACPTAAHWREFLARADASRTATPSHSNIGGSGDGTGE